MAEELNPWADRSAPSLDDFNTIAAETFDSLPTAFREAAGKLVITITDFPDDDVLTGLGISTPFQLLGLFQGVGLAEGSDTETGEEPNRIWLYRRPILDYWAEHEETLQAVINHVLIHEIGHHFGLSDEDMHMLEDGT